MMAWIAAFALAALAWAALWKSGRCSRLALEISAAALLLGISGYAWQGKPEMPGNPVHQPAN
jgi:cytochrome c-type biogenesis protein CcmH